MREELRKLPDGTWSFTDYIDRDPVGDSEEPIPVHLEMTIDGDRLIMDLSQTGAQARGPVNCTASAARSAIMAGVHAIFHEIPWNEGLEWAVELTLKAETVVNAEYPRPVSGMAASPGEKVLACVHGCMVQILPERSMACPTNLVNVNIFGFDTRPDHDGEEFVMYLWLAGGWGGRPGKRDAHTSLFPMGPSTNLQPVEFLEQMYPVSFYSFELKPDSEGPGRHRGGFALQCPWQATHGEATVNVQGDRQRLHGWGVDGGWPHEGTDLVYAPGTEDERRIDVMSANNHVAPRTRVDYWQSGGGGWRDPFTRPPDWVLDDVRNGLVSPTRARDVYGVEIEPADDPLDLKVDLGKTEELRKGASPTPPPAGGR
ncbi:MAG: hydantoinase B/oxoprolinase family protein [Actinomycetota bacterium]